MGVECEGVGVSYFIHVGGGAYGGAGGEDGGAAPGSVDVDPDGSLVIIAACCP